MNEKYPFAPRNHANVVSWRITYFTSLSYEISVKFPAPTVGVNVVLYIKIMLHHRLTCEYPKKDLANGDRFVETV
jgi:hypothetical protein